jgi:hypothetical protein
MLAVANVATTAAAGLKHMTYSSGFRAFEE